MSDKNDFDFEDDFLGDDNEPFDFDEEEGFPSGLGDELESDMPEIEEEPEERGGNRTFVFLAGIMIVLFVAALAVVLFLATRPTGPTDLQLTASQVVMLNSTVDSQAAGTSTQNSADFFLTQTAAAWTATPSPTLTPTETLVPTETITPSPTEFHPTVTPTPTLDLTQIAILQLANGALTLTAIAANASPIPTDTPVPPTDTPVPAGELDLRSAFATQLAYATQIGAFDQDGFGTRVAAATAVANTSIDTAGELNLRHDLDSTQSALDAQSGSVATAIAYVDTALASSAQQNADLATQLAIVIPAGIQTQAALGTPFAAATVAAVETQAALGTLSADSSRGTSPIATPGATAAGKITIQEIGRVQQDATDAIVGTRDAFSTQAAQATRGSIATQESLATQMAFATPPIFATQAAIATQVALATRQQLINMALGLVASPTPTGNPLEAVNMTATAIAGAFLTATAQAFTPGAATIIPAQAAFPTAVSTALPQTGLFDDVVSGGTNTIGVLALTVVGLVGVIAVSRRMRSSSSRDEEQDTQASAPPPEPPDEE